MVSPGIAYRMAAWRAPHEAGSGRLILVEHCRGRARLHYSTSHDNDRAECLRRQAWAVAIAERCGGRRVTLREDGCLAEREPACEYTVSWIRAPGPAAAGIGVLLTLVGLLAASYRHPIPAAAWMLTPVAAAVAHVIERRRAARGNVAAEAEVGAAFRWLLEQAVTRRPQPIAATDIAPIAAPVATSPSLEQEGEFWRIAFGGTTILLRHSRGLALLAHLVRCPGREVHVRELDAITPSGGSAVARDSPAPDAGMLPLPGDGGERLDAQARAEYRRRVIELRAELDDAEQRHDQGRAEAVRAELDLLVHELGGENGGRRRVRRAPTDVERGRVAITRRIRSAIARIAKHHPSLGGHLAASVTTGYYCAYRPDTAASLPR